MTKMVQGPAHACLARAIAVTLTLCALLGFGNAHAADLAMTKTAATSGSTVTFTLTPANVSTAMGLPYNITETVTDTVPAMFTVTGVSVPFLSGWSCSPPSQTITCTRTGAVAANQAMPAITIVATAIATGTYTNCATVTFVPNASTQPDLVPGNNMGCVTGSATAALPHDVYVNKVRLGSGPITSGSNVTFTLMPGNSGPAGLFIGSGDATVTDLVPAGFSLVSTTAALPNWTCVVIPGISCTYVGPPVAAGNALPTFNITLQANATGLLQNCAQIAYNHPPGDAWPVGNNACANVTVTGGPPDVRVTKVRVGTSAIHIGQNVTFTITAFNNSTAPMTFGQGDVTITDIVPPGFVFVSQTSAPAGIGWNCSGAVLTCTFSGYPAPVAAGNALPPITLVLRAVAPAGVRQNCASVAYNRAPGDSTPGNNLSCVTMTILP